MFKRTAFVGAIALVAGITAAAQSPRTTTALYAFVTDNTGGLIGTLGSSDFNLEIDGKTTPFDASIDREPGAFVMLLDRSGSMSVLLDQMADMASVFARELPPRTRLEIAPVSPAVLTRPPAELPEKRDLAGRIRAIPYRNDSPIWDSVAGAINAFGALHGYRAIVVVSDGEDTRSRTSLSDVVKRAQQSNVAVHGIFVFATMLPGGMPFKPSGSALKKLAQETGGLVWPGQQIANTEALGVRSAAILKTRYVIRCSAPAGAKEHSVKLRTTNPQLHIAVTKKFKA